MTSDEQLEQRRAALETANAIRSARSRLKRDLHADRQLELARRVIAAAATRGQHNGELRALAAEYGAPDGFTDTMTTATFLQACSGFGKVKTTKVLRTSNIAASRRLGQITNREALAIYSVLTIAAERRTNQEDTTP